MPGMQRERYIRNMEIAVGMVGEGNGVRFMFASIALAPVNPIVSFVLFVASLSAMGLGVGLHVDAIRRTVNLHKQQ